METTHTLSDRQTILALKTFYDLTPDSAWEGGEKPSPHRVRSLVADLQEDAPEEYKTLLHNLVSEQGDEATIAARAQVCRLALMHFAETPSLKTYVDQATAGAAQAHMIIDPVTGAFIVFLVLAVFPKIENKPGDFKIIPAYGLTQLVKHLPAVISALPKEILTSLGAKILG